MQNAGNTATGGPGCPHASRCARRRSMPLESFSAQARRFPSHVSKGSVPIRTDSRLDVDAQMPQSASGRHFDAATDTGASIAVMTNSLTTRGPRTAPALFNTCGCAGAGAPRAGDNAGIALDRNTRSARRGSHAIRVRAPREVATPLSDGLDLTPLSVAAAHPRHLRVEVGLELEEVQMPPFPHQGVMHRLVFGPAVRAGEARSRLKGHLKVDAPRLRIEGHIDHFPGRLQAQGHGEQGRRRSSHGSTLTRTACGFVDASCGPARALRDVWTTPGPRRQPPCDRRASHRRGPPVAHTLGPRAHNSTGTATSLLNGAGHGGQWN